MSLAAALVVAARADRAGARASASTAESPQPYSFYPQAGTLWQDLYVNNFVDLEPLSPGTRDWDCSTQTYDGHRGYDTDLRSFREQRIGVPVFAALDGTVVSTHDGEPDENAAATSVPDNEVVLDHGNGQRSIYGHLRKGSVAVSPGQRVVAGEQIGLTGSSGSSTWPHLHFESQLDGAPYEPSAGPCRPGSTLWRSQTPIRRDLYVRDFSFGTGPDVGRAAVPWDESVRVGSFPAGTRLLYPRLDLANQPPGVPYRLQFVRPNGTVAVEHVNTFGNASYCRNHCSWSWAFTVDLDSPGTWRLRIATDAATLVDAPFAVEAEPTGNRPPNDIAVGLEPAAPVAGDVPVCRVQTSLVTEDPDYDIVRYVYRWTRGSTVVREVVSAALSDALPRTSVPAGDAVGCTVTPSDGSALGRPGSVSASVGGSPQAPPQPPAPAPPAPPAPKTPVRRCAVPDVRGKPLASARKALIRSGCRSGRLAFAPSSLPKGHVVRQSPAAGTKLPAGAPVALTLSNGRKR